MTDTLDEAVQELREAIRRKEPKEETKIIKAFAIQQRNAALEEAAFVCRNYPAFDERDVELRHEIAKVIRSLMKRER